MKAKDLHTPQQYEVVKLKIGTELVAMTRDRADKLELTLPMCYTLTPAGDGTSNTTFYPFAPTSKSTNIVIDKEDIMYRAEVSEQFIPIYDKASSSWATMIEAQSIPISTGQVIKSPSLQRMHELLEDYMGDAELDEEWDDDILDVSGTPKIIH